MQYLITTFDNGNVDWSFKAQLLKDEAKHIHDLYQKGIIRNIWFSENKDALLISTGVIPRSLLRRSKIEHE